MKSLMENKILVLGLAVLAVAAVAAVFTFKILPEDSATGALTDVPSNTAEQPAEKPEGNLKFSEGMSKDEVTAIGGEPLEKQTIKTPSGNKVEYWYYEDGKDVYQVAFDSSNTVSAVRIY